MSLAPMCHSPPATDLDRAKLAGPEQCPDLVLVHVQLFGRLRDCQESTGFTGSSVTGSSYVRQRQRPRTVRIQGLVRELFLVVDGFSVHGLQRGEPCFHFGLLPEVFQGGELGVKG